MRHLSALPDLRVLWLCENPCAAAADYRPAVLRALPNLTKLDNTEVSDSERAAAARAAASGRAGGESGRQAEASTPAAAPSSATPPKNGGGKHYVLYAVMALLNELDADDLGIVRRECEHRLFLSGGPGPEGPK